MQQGTPETVDTVSEKPTVMQRFRNRMRALVAWWRGTSTYRVLMRWTAPLRRWYRRWEGSRSHRFFMRWGRIFAGLALIAAGIAMLVLPGQGILTIIAGLAVMAPEVPLANRLMQRLKKRVKQTEKRVRSARKKRA